LPTSKGPPPSLVQLRIAVWTDDARDTRPLAEVRSAVGCSRFGAVMPGRHTLTESPSADCESTPRGSPCTSTPSGQLVSSKLVTERHGSGGLVVYQKPLRLGKYAPRVIDQREASVHAEAFSFLPSAFHNRFSDMPCQRPHAAEVRCHLAATRRPATVDAFDRLWGKVCRASRLSIKRESPRGMSRGAVSLF
jgi:hypothetical protein